MTITSRQKRVPDELPPAKLYVDDLQEIVNIFREAIEVRRRARTGAEKTEFETKFEVDEQSCDDLEELLKLPRRPKHFKLTVSDGWGDLHLSVSGYATWGAWGLNNDEKWSVFRKIEAVFGRRRMPWRVGFGYRRLNIVSGLMLGLSWIFALAMLEGKIRVFVAGPLVVALTILGIAVSKSASTDSIVILRNSYDDRSRREEFRSKLVLAVIGAVVGSVITLLVAYLKNKIGH